MFASLLQVILTKAKVNADGFDTQLALVYVALHLSKKKGVGI